MGTERRVSVTRAKLAHWVGPDLRTVAKQVRAWEDSFR